MKVFVICHRKRGRRSPVLSSGPGESKGHLTVTTTRQAAAKLALAGEMIVPAELRPVITGRGSRQVVLT